MSKATILIDVLILTNRTVIDGTVADPIFGRTVVFHKDRILAVGPAAGYDVSPTHASLTLEAERSCRDSSTPTYTRPLTLECVANS